MTNASALKDIPPAPFLSSVMQIEPQWIDYNGHLNMAYYNVMMDRAIDELWLQLGVGPTYMKERHGSTFTVECHVRYLREIHLGDPVQVAVWLLDADEKRLHTFEELRHANDGWVSATSENGKHDHSYRHESAEVRRVSAGHPRSHCRRACKPFRHRAARGYRSQGCDACQTLILRSREAASRRMRPQSVSWFETR